MTEPITPEVIAEATPEEIQAAVAQIFPALKEELPMDVAESQSPLGLLPFSGPPPPQVVEEEPEDG